MADEMNTNLDRLATFKRVNDGMISTSDIIYGGNYGSDRQRRQSIRTYSDEDVKRITESGDVAAQKRMSRDYFYSNGFYRSVITYYATLLKYTGILIPNPKGNEPLNSPNMLKRYNKALDLLEHMDIPTLLTNWAFRALIDGCYYGILAVQDKNHFSVIDLPAEFCTTRFKDLNNNNIVEFNLAYFDKIDGKQLRKQLLSVYPDIVSTAYRKWKNGKGPKWIILPSDIGICFMFADGRPPFLSVIPATRDYEQTVDSEIERALEEIKKIIVQKIPHNASTNELVFEPDEALEMHRGAVNMMRSSKNVSVLTTYADVDSVVSKTSAESTATAVENMANAIYYEAGISGQIFGVNTATAVDKNVRVSIATMMVLANKFSNFITTLLNRYYSNSNISFAYHILPISYQNDDTFLDEAFKLASSGYSLIIPALSMGISQRELSNLKTLENDVLGLTEDLLPLQSSYTQSGSGESEVGRPEKTADEKAPTTLETEDSRAQ